MLASKRTALFALHQRLGARMTVFGGFEMPVSYSGIVAEHRAVRAAAGIFDLSHMGEFEIRGPRALPLLERTLTNSAARLGDRQAQYTLLCAEDGGAIDDLIVYRLGAERYLLCVNASNIDADREWLMSRNTDGAELRDRSDETALVAMQGPRSVAILARLADFDLAAVPRFHFAEGDVAGVRVLAARTGYTGEDGFELFADPEHATDLFEALLDTGARDGLVPCGLGARDTLRLEAGLPLYGHELDRATTPLEAGLGAFVKFGRDFIGGPALLASREQGLRKRLIGVATADSRSIARQGYRVFDGNDEAGVITSGTLAPTLARPIAMAYLNAPHRPTDSLAVEIRGQRAPLTTMTLPFYRRGQTAAANRSASALLQKEP